MKRKKLLGVLVLLAAMVFGVTACGDGNETDAGSTAQTEVQGVDEEADAQETADEDTVPVSDLEYEILDDGTAAIVRCNNGDKYKTLVIPEEIDGYKVTAIGIPDTGRVTGNILFNSAADGTYDGDPTVEKLVIPDTVKTIGHGAIGINKNLKEVDLGNGVEVIEEAAFCNTGIEQIELPESLKKLEYMSLPITLKEATFLGGELEECGNYFFEGCVVYVPAGSKTEEVVKNMAEETGGTIVSE
ncbi:MAG: leucine-rich repeat domain-containing protein [Roseburia sp.]